MESIELSDLPGSLLDQDEPVFKEPWQARAFALACALQQQGVFSRTEWAENLGRTISKAQQEGDQDLGDTYYQHWLNCLEELTVAKGLATPEELVSGKQSAHEAHQRMHEELGHFHSHHHSDENH